MSRIKYYTWDLEMKVGYQRVSSSNQNLSRQELGDDVERLFAEKISGKNTDRPALQEMISFVREGDEVVVYSIDRLARDLRDLQTLIQQLNDKGVRVTFLSERLSFGAEADDAFAKLQLQMMGAFAEFERNIIRKRQAEGIEKAKKRGAYKGRQSSIDPKKIAQMQAEGLSPTQISRELGISRQSVYRLSLS